MTKKHLSAVVLELGSHPKVDHSIELHVFLSVLLAGGLN